MNQVRIWEKKGRPGGKPPGVAKLAPTVTEVVKRDYFVTRPAWLSRPETIESIYVMYRTTGDVVWRERGWAIFQAIDKYARTSSGYTSISGVDMETPRLEDSMPSYFMAETLKYLYLLFLEDDRLPADRWVFNTEAHPLPIFEWREWEKKAYSIH